MNGTQRRLRLELTMEADDLQVLASALRVFANDLELDGREDREQMSGGYDSSHHFTLRCDPEMNGDKYRAGLLSRTDIA